MPRFDIEDALELATFTAPTWNADGSRVGYGRFFDGDTDFVGRRVDSDTNFKTGSRDDENVFTFSTISEHDWHPEDPAVVAAIQDGDVVRLNVQTGASDMLAAGSDSHSSLTWNPDGKSLAYVRNNELWLHDLSDGRTTQLPGTVASLFGPTPLKWHQDGGYLATLTETDEGTRALTVWDSEELESRSEDTAEKAIVWEREPDPAEHVLIDVFEWVGDSLVFCEDGQAGTDRTYCIVNPDETELSNTGNALLTTHDERGIPSSTMVGHDSGQLAVVAPVDGHYHVHIVDIDTRREYANGKAEPGLDGAGIIQITEGAFEARGDALDAPAWDETGNRLAYVTNEHDVGERRLHVATIADNEERVVNIQAVADEGGNTIYPTWDRTGEQIACLHAGRTTPASVHVVEVEYGGTQSVSVAHESPDSFSWFPDPQPVEFESSRDGESVHGYLYAPDRTVTEDDRPAIIWAHGGPVRQMRRGFHHMRSYAFFHAFNHVLVDRGYVILELNYRGSIGYGRDYETGIHKAVGETDVRDCVDAATFLRNHELVGDQIGLWGLSYGGFLANAIATKTDIVDCAVNFAGIWDWRDWVRYATARNWVGRRFQPLFGGHPDTDALAVEERYRIGSPVDHIGGLDTPLFALHGTDDPNVPFDQMDALVSDLVAEGSNFEMAYYPNEDHMFQSSETWYDAMSRVLPFFNEHLR